MNPATVTAISPAVTVLSDGDLVEVPAEGGGAVSVGDRVLVEIINNTAYIVVRLNAPLWPAAGIILPFGGPLASIPPQTLACIGGTASRTTYARLFTAVGTTHGSGDGSTTFGLPDGRDRPLIGAGTFAALGTTDGLAEALRTLRHTHPVTEGGSHNHSIVNHGGHSHNISSSGDHGHPIELPFGGSSHGSGDMGTASNTSGNGSLKRLTSGEAHQHGGNTGQNGSHDHTGAVGSGGDHDHSGSTGSQSAHDHGGVTGQSATNATPYLAVNWVITT